MQIDMADTLSALTVPKTGTLGAFRGCFCSYCPSLRDIRSTQPFHFHSIFSSANQSCWQLRFPLPARGLLLVLLATVAGHFQEVVQGMVIGGVDGQKPKAELVVVIGR